MALQGRYGRYFWVPHYPVKTVTLCRDPTGSTRYLTYESAGSLYISYTLLIVNNSGQGSKIHAFVQMALQGRDGRYFWVARYPVKTVTLCRDPTGSTRNFTYESVGSLYISYTLLIVNNSGQGSKIHAFVQMALQGRYRRHVWVPYNPVSGVTITVKYKIGNKCLTKSLLCRYF